MGSTVGISHSSDGALLFTTPWGEWRFIEVEPLYFRQVDGPLGIVFREDDRGVSQPCLLTLPRCLRLKS